MNVFDELTTKNIPYAVVVSKIRSAKGKIEGLGREYFVIALRKDIKGLVNRFKPSRTIDGLSEYNLRGAHLKRFREESTKYSLVIDNEGGRVFEAGEPFRAYFKTHRPK